MGKNLHRANLQELIKHCPYRNSSTMGRDQLFEALPLTENRKNRWITIGGEEAVTVMPSSKDSSGGVLLTARVKQRLGRLKDSRHFGSGESSYNGDPRVAIASTLLGNTRGGGPYGTISHQATKFLNCYSHIKHQINKRVDHSS
jgi:hypothetical protein